MLCMSKGAHTGLGRTGRPDRGYGGCVIFGGRSGMRGAAGQSAGVSSATGQSGTGEERKEGSVVLQSLALAAGGRLTLEKGG